MPNNLQEQVNTLKQQLESLRSEYYLNNFSGSQDFNKDLRINTSVRLPVYGTAPATCNVGQVYVNTGDGKLYVCSAVNTWSAQT